MSETAEIFDFRELEQAIMNAREKQRITREELAEELDISARHLQSVEKEEPYPSFQLVTMFHIFVDQYIHTDSPTGKTTLRRQVDTLLDTFGDADLTVIEGTVQGICKAKEKQRNNPLCFSFARFQYCGTPYP